MFGRILSNISLINRYVDQITVQANDAIVSESADEIRMESTEKFFIGIVEGITAITKQLVKKSKGK